MPLKITLAPEEKIIINSVVIANAGAAATLSVLNHAQILRGKDILTPEDAKTPATHIYYVVQCLYLFPDRAEDYLEVATQFLNDYRKAAPSSASLVDDISKKLKGSEIYSALKTAKKLLAHEKEVFTHVPDANAPRL